jgi:hypothetical protein
MRLFILWLWWWKALLKCYSGYELLSFYYGVLPFKLSSPIVKDCNEALWSWQKALLHCHSRLFFTMLPLWVSSGIAPKDCNEALCDLPSYQLINFVAMMMLEKIWYISVAENFLSLLYEMPPLWISPTIQTDYNKFLCAKRSRKIISLKSRKTKTSIYLLLFPPFHYFVYVFCPKGLVNVPCFICKLIFTYSFCNKWHQDLCINAFLIFFEEGTFLKSR